MVIAVDDGIVDPVVVERIIDGDTGALTRAVPGELHEVVRTMLRRRRHHTDIAVTLHVSYSKARMLIRAVADERCRYLLQPGGHCDGCAGPRRVPAEWQVTSPDGARREYCLRHAAAALTTLDG